MDQVLEAKHTLEQVEQQPRTSVLDPGAASSNKNNALTIASGATSAAASTSSSPRSVPSSGPGVGPGAGGLLSVIVSSSSSVTLSSPRRESTGSTGTAVSSVVIANPTQRLDGQQATSADNQRKVSEVNASPRSRGVGAGSDVSGQRGAAPSSSSVPQSGFGSGSSAGSALLQAAATPTSASENRPSPDSPVLDFTNVTIRRPRTPRHAVSMQQNQNQTDSAAAPSAVDDPSFSIPRKARDLTNVPQEVIREVAQATPSQDVPDAPSRSSLQQSRTLAPSPVQSLYSDQQQQLLQPSFPQRSASFRERRADASWIKSEADGPQVKQQQQQQQQTASATGTDGAGRSVPLTTESRASLYRVAAASSPTASTSTPSATASHITVSSASNYNTNANASGSSNQPSAATSVELVRQRRRSQRTLTAMVPPNQSDPNSSDTQSDRDSSRPPSMQEPVSSASTTAVASTASCNETQSINSLVSPPVGSRSDWGGSRDVTPTPGGAAGGVSSRPSSAPPAEILEQPRILTRYAGSQAPRTQGSLDISASSNSSRSRPLHQVSIRFGFVTHSHRARVHY